VRAAGQAARRARHPVGGVPRGGAVAPRTAELSQGAPGGMIAIPSKRWRDRCEKSR
jgi:hypothetical protein